MKILYLIFEKLSDEIIDVIEMDDLEKADYLKNNPNHYFEEAEEFFGDDDDYIEDDDDDNYSEFDEEWN